MISSRITPNGWLQIVIQSDEALNDIQSFQARVTKSELHDLNSCLDETLRRIDWVHNNYHTDKEAKEIYTHADVVRFGSSVAISYHSIYRVHLIFRASSMYLSIGELDGLLSSLKELLDS